jgi:6-phosphogluconate dehydrogenase (decarboxylating)
VRFSHPHNVRHHHRYENTERRLAKVEAKGILYLGMGVSGGEEGARRGALGRLLVASFVSVLRG